MGFGMETANGIDQGRWKTNSSEVDIDFKISSSRQFIKLKVVGAVAQSK